MEQAAAIKNGSHQTFTEVFGYTYKKVFGFFMNRTNKNRELSKELSQLAYIKLWNSRLTLSDEHPIEKQLFVIAKYTLIDHLRKEANQEKLTAIVSENTSSITPFPTTRFEGNDLVVAILKKLPPARKKVLQLKMLYGYSNNEIAGIMSISIKTVEDHVTKGLSELRKVAGVSPILFSLLFFCAY